MMISLAMFLPLICQDPGPANSSPQALPSEAQPQEAEEPQGTRAQRPPGPRHGVQVREPGATSGFTLFAPLQSGSTWLINDEGRAVHSWERKDSPGNSVYLLDNGNLLRCEKFDSEAAMTGGGEGGRIVELDWDGKLLWEYELCTDEQRLHHDIEPLPNGNIRAIVWSAKSRRDTVHGGRDPEGVGPEGLWVDSILELKPTRPEGAEIVWEWHAFDHLVQDFDSERANFGKVADHPRRVNINIGTAAAAQPESEEQKKERLELEKNLRAMGYAGGDADDDQDGGRARGHADWMHTNGISYDAGLDLIAISPRSFSEVWVIDHSTSTAEAKTSSGGRQGVGGDLVWRVGNPEQYHQGRPKDRTLFGQHDPQWTRVNGQPALSIFNNGESRPDAKYSSVEMLLLPVNGEGVFGPLTNHRFPSATLQSSWTMPNREDLYSGRISGTHALPSGGLLVCDGEGGRIIETDADGKVIWEFISPVGRKVGEGGAGGARGPRGPRGRRGPRDGRQGPRRGPPDGQRRQGPPGDGPPDGGPPRGAGGGGPRNGNSMFRATRYPLDHPAFEGRKFVPRDLPLETIPPPPTGAERAGPREREEPAQEGGGSNA